MGEYRDYEFLLVEQLPAGVALVTLNRPERLNAVHTLMHLELERLFRELNIDPNLRGVVLTGAGRGFCSGGDQKEFHTRPPLDPTGSARHLIRDILELEVPLIAAVNGAAVGLGATLALFCDAIFAQPSARFADTHVNAGVVAGDGGAIIWPLLVGPIRAKHYLMTGEFLSAEQAFNMGVVTALVPEGTVKDEAIKYATKLANGPKDAIRWTKYCVNKMIKEQLNLILDTSLALEALTARSPEKLEAVQAFMEKKKRFLE